MENLAKMFAMKLSKFVEFISTKVESNDKCCARGNKKVTSKKKYYVESLAPSPGVKKRSLKVTPLPFFTTSYFRAIRMKLFCCLYHRSNLGNTRNNSKNIFITFNGKINKIK